MSAGINNFNRYKFGDKVTAEDIMRMEDNVERLEKSQDAYRHYMLRILRDKMFMNVDENATMDELITKIDGLGDAIVYGNGQAYSEVAPDLTNIVPLDAVGIYCKNIADISKDANAVDYGTIHITARYLEDVKKPRYMIENKNRRLVTVNDRYLDYTIDATTLGVKENSGGGAYFILYFDPNSHTNSIELKIDGDGVDWLCFNTTMPISLDLGENTCTYLQSIACGPIIPNITKNNKLNEINGIRFRTASEIIKFENCTNLEIINNIDFSYPNPYYSFEGCTNLYQIPGINTSNCRRLDKLFKNCNNIQYSYNGSAIDLNMNECRNACEMFMGCTNLENDDFNLTNINTLQIADRMFANSKCYKTVPMLNIKRAEGMYQNNAIINNDMEGDLVFNGGGTTDKSAIINIKNMFAFDPEEAGVEDKFTGINGNFVTNDCSLEADGLYKGRTKLINATGLTASTKIHSANDMFNGCSGIVTLPNMDLSECVRYSHMFAGCTNLSHTTGITLNFANLEWSAAYPASEGIFNGCKNLTGSLTIQNMCKPYDLWLVDADVPPKESPKFTSVLFENMTDGVAGTTISVKGLNLDADALNAMFNTLADVNNKLADGIDSYIIIQDNPGSDTCDVNIALAKGWKVKNTTEGMVKLATLITMDDPKPYCEATFEEGVSTGLVYDAKEIGEIIEKSVRKKYEVDIYGWGNFTSIKFNSFNGNLGPTDPEALDVRGPSFITAGDVLECDLNVTKTCNNLDYTLLGLTSLTRVNTSEWDVSNVTSMQVTFTSCYSLTDLDVSNWNTSKVTDMTCMFEECNELININIGSWNTNNVISMDRMFYNCFTLTTIGNISNWNTSKVRVANSMFTGCHSLTDLDVSNWTCDSLTNAYGMFCDCLALTTLDVSKWKANIERTDYMFAGCSSLTTLDLSKWNVSNVVNMNSMFYGCSSLTTLDLSKWNVSSVTDMDGMFASCSSLTTLNLSNWNMDNVIDPTGMFNGCTNLHQAGITMPTHAATADKIKAMVTT